MKRAEALVRVAAGRDPSEGLAAVAALRRVIERLEALHVRSARSQGWSWQQIADELGVSRQAVHKKHAPFENEDLTR